MMGEPTEIRVEPLSGDALHAVLPALADLRIAVFRAFPYLYDGTVAYETWYLSKLAEAVGAVVVGAFDGDRLVGAATGTPLAAQHEDFRAPFMARGEDISATYYFAESVLLPAYRGRGVGHAFFDHREAHARGLGGFRAATFCAVVRPEDHPARPADYQPLDPFWRKRGYAPVPGLTCAFAWQDVGGDAETEKTMQFWLRNL